MSDFNPTGSAENNETKICEVIFRDGVPVLPSEYHNEHKLTVHKTMFKVKPQHTFSDVRKAYFRHFSIDIQNYTLFFYHDGEVLAFSPPGIGDERIPTSIPDFGCVIGIRREEITFNVSIQNTDSIVKFVDKTIHVFDYYKVECTESVLITGVDWTWTISSIKNVMASQLNISSECIRDFSFMHTVSKTSFRKSRFTVFEDEEKPIMYYFQGKYAKNIKMWMHDPIKHNFARDCTLHLSLVRNV